MWLQAWLRYQQHRLEEAKSEGLCALDCFEKLGAAHDVDKTRRLLERIDSGARGMEHLRRMVSYPKTALLIVSIDSSRLDEITESE